MTADLSLGIALGLLLSFALDGAWRVATSVRRRRAREASHQRCRCQGCGLDQSIVGKTHNDILTCPRCGLHAAPLFGKLDQRVPVNWFDLWFLARTAEIAINVTTIDQAKQQFARTIARLSPLRPAASLPLLAAEQAEEQRARLEVALKAAGFVWAPAEGKAPVPSPLDTLQAVGRVH